MLKKLDLLIEPINSYGLNTEKILSKTHIFRENSIGSVFFELLSTA
jgi:hypothetical protein